MNSQFRYASICSGNGALRKAIQCEQDMLTSTLFLNSVKPLGSHLHINSELGKSQERLFGQETEKKGKQYGIVSCVHPTAAAGFFRFALIWSFICFHR